MSIGITIKHLRREKEITQEQLAEYLGITSRAVSQWECDRTAPDLSQIPALCHIFGVTADMLLGIDGERSREAIKEYLCESERLTKEGKREERTALLREANKRFPRNYEIMLKLADAIVCEYSRKKIKEYDEVYALCRRILDECTDNELRYEAIDTLATAYCYAGNAEEELKLARQMPSVIHSYEHYMEYRWGKGDNDLHEMQNYIHFLLHALLAMTANLSGHQGDDGRMTFTWEQRKAMRRTALTLLETVFPDGDYQYFAQYGEMICSFFVTDSHRAGDDDALWRWLERGADFAIHADTYDFEAPHTSPLLRGFASGGWIMEPCGNRSQSLLGWLTTDGDMARFRTDERYTRLVDRLSEVAKKG